MRADPGFLAIYVEPARAAQAVAALRESGQEDVRVTSPAPFPELMTALRRPPSFVDWITFPGALLGLACGLLLTILTSLSWKLVTGGKPIVSLPPFTVITFELTVLVGSLANLLALAIGARRGMRRGYFAWGGRLTRDRIGIFCGSLDPAVEQLLRASGAEEVTRVS